MSGNKFKGYGFRVWYIYIFLRKRKEKRQEEKKGKESNKEKRKELNEIRNMKQIATM